MKANVVGLIEQTEGRLLQLARSAVEAQHGQASNAAEAFFDLFSPVSQAEGARRLKGEFQRAIFGALARAALEQALAEWDAAQRLRQPGPRPPEPKIVADEAQRTEELNHAPVDPWKS